jgi:sortase (surface protein transpeptidase)
MSNSFGRTLIVVMSVIGAACLTIAALSFIDYLNATQSGDETPSSMTVVEDGLPSERPVDMSAPYSVPNDQPRSINIPKIDVDAYVQPVGILPTKLMATPTNIYFTGWYVHGVAPGEPGLAIINGHEGGRYVSGVFKRINELAPDDTFSVQMGDLSWRNFVITSVKSYAVADAAQPLFARDPSIESELHLITCGGTFDDKNQTYDQRVIVSARYTIEL